MAGRKSPSATLISWPDKPIKLIYELFFFSKHGKEMNCDNRATDNEFAFVLQLLKEDWCGLLEFPTFVWNFVLPRSHHAQMRTHRHWSFFSQSHQLHEPDNFADERDYFKIPDEKGRNVESATMIRAQTAYRKLRKMGILPSLARGVLPMHINLGLSAACNLRSMFQTIVLRKCDILQGTYWNPLLKEMKTELMGKVDKRLGCLFDLKPCDINNKCLSSIEQDLRVVGKDPHQPCEIYINKFFGREYNDQDS